MSGEAPATGAPPGASPVPPTVALKNLTGDTGASEISPETWIAVWLAAGILAGIIILSWVVGQLSFGSLSLPPAPVPPSPVTTEGLGNYKTLIDRYKELSDLQVGRFKDLFQLMVITALLPSFTTILGYLFGKRQA